MKSKYLKYLKSPRTTPLCIRYVRKMFDISNPRILLLKKKLCWILIWHVSAAGCKEVENSHLQNQKSESECRHFDLYKQFLPFHIFIGVSIIQARSWMIYLDRVDKGMESLIQSIIWLESNYLHQKKHFPTSFQWRFSGKFWI